jgi:hypothetical protein
VIRKILLVTYQSNPLAKYPRKRIENVDVGFEPSPQSLISAPRLLELADLVLKYGQNVCGRVACSELASERMRGKILFGLCFICFEGFSKTTLKLEEGIEVASATFLELAGFG